MILTWATNHLASVLPPPQEHAVRGESPEEARALDVRAAQAWQAHPYFDVVDNSTGFDDKVWPGMGRAGL